jgi:site-specific recombinase XerD
MSLSNRGGNWHYRFWAAGRRWTGNTGLAATERKKSSALLKEAEVRKQVLEGKGDHLHLEVRGFSDAADQFIEWAKGEHRAKPHTWKRLRTSMTSLREFFKMQPLHSIKIGEIQDYMAWRRRMEIKEVSLRHDLHALSPLFKYGIAHNWCRENPVTSENLKLHGAKMPSDADAVRIHVLTRAEEMLYFHTCLRPPEQITVKSKPHVQTRNGKRVQVAAYDYTKLAPREYRNLHDVGRLMLLQGTRPAEVMQARVEGVDLEQGTWFIPKSKSAAGERTLRLTAEARSILAELVASAPQSGWLFEGKTSDTHLQNLENAHQAVLEATGQAFVMYDLRHTFATRFYQATKDVVALKEVLGHSNLRTIMKYVHISQDHVDGAMRVLRAKFVPIWCQRQHQERSTRANERKG